MPETSHPEFILEEIPLTELRLDARYQRDLSEEDVAEIVHDFHPEQFQPITVGMRSGTDSLHIVDGQHRVAAARRMGWKTVPCMIFDSRGFEHEAEVYELLQTKRAPLTVAQRWKARVARKEPKAIAITEIVEALGLRLANASIGATTLCAYVACELAYERGNLRDTLLLIIQAWEYDPTGFRSTFITMVSQFLSAMTAQHFAVDMKRLVTTLSNMPPKQFLRDAALAQNPNAVFMRRLLDSYNKGLRAGKIEVDDPVALLRVVKAKRGALKFDPVARSANATAMNTALTPEERSRRASAAAAARHRGKAS